MTWDKGSSGLVFYTDAQYWHSLKSDEERNCDDWDVDMSIYYRDARPDLDSTQLMEMKEEHDAREGSSNHKSVFKKRIPKTYIRNELALKSGKVNHTDVTKTSTVHFPVFVKDSGHNIMSSSKKKVPRKKEDFEGNEFALKQMQKHGWQKGQGLGINNRGIKMALDGEIDGQRSRAGLGYRE